MRELLAHRLRPGEMEPRVALIAVAPDCTVAEAADRLTDEGVSQLPVIDHGEVVGTVQESVVMQRLYRDPAIASRPVSEIMEAPLPILDVDAELEEAYLQLSGGASGVLVAAGGGRGEVLGIVTKADIVDYLAHKAAQSSKLEARS
jgi:predicted transcriptional regulator